MGQSTRWILIAVALLASALTIAVTPATAVSAGDTLQAYTVPDGVGGIAEGPDGAMWFTQPTEGTVRRIGLDGTQTPFPVPSGRPELVVTGPDGNLWYLATNPMRLGRMTTSGAATEFTLPNTCCARGLASGPGGDVWFSTQDTVGRITMGGAITTYPFGGRDLTAGADGNAWLITNSGIASITPAGVVTTYPHANAKNLAAGSDGNLWVSHQNADSARVDVLSTAGALVETMTLTGVNEVTDLATGPDGAIWLGASPIDDSFAYIHRLNVDRSLQRFEYEVGHADGKPNALTPGPSGTLWFAKNFFEGGLARFSIPGATATSVAASTATSDYGDPVTFTATVTSPFATATPTGGYVQFFTFFRTPLGAPVPLVDGTATLTTTALKGGSSRVYAHYLGEGSFLGSWSNRKGVPVDVFVTPEIYAVAAVLELRPLQVSVIQLTAHLLRPDGVGWITSPVVFTDASGNVLCNATAPSFFTSPESTATCSILDPAKILAVVTGGGYTVTLPANGIYRTASASAPLIRL